jgi:ankyrin repeat protein
MDDDADGVKRLLRLSGVHTRLDCMLARMVPRRPGRSRLLHLAAYSNSVGVARLLIDSGEGVNSRNGIGDTPLHMAARYNAWEVADLLISLGARVCALNHAGQTPLDTANDAGNLSVAELLEMVAG